MFARARNTDTFYFKLGGREKRRHERGQSGGEDERDKETWRSRAGERISKIGTDEYQKVI